jgi:hypothetical protein
VFGGNTGVRNEAASFSAFPCIVKIPGYMEVPGSLDCIDEGKGGDAEDSIYEETYLELAKR